MNPPEPETIAGVIKAAKKVAQGDFTLEKNLLGTNINLKEKGYLTIYNSHWRRISGPLSSQIIPLQVALFKAQNKTGAELSVEPGLSHVREALSAMDTINNVEMPRFLDNVNRLTAEIFATPATDSDLFAAKKKSCADA